MEKWRDRSLLSSESAILDALEKFVVFFSSFCQSLSFSRLLKNGPVEAGGFIEEEEILDDEDMIWNEDNQNEASSDDDEQ